MKFNVILLATIFFISCNGTSQQSEPQKSNEQNWQVAQVLTQVHSYNKLGLLDTTHRVQDVYVNGVSGVVMNFLITREYDNRNNLISKKTFQVFKKKNELSEEVLYKYDAKNNLVVVTEKSENVVSKIIRNTYNDKNQKMEEMKIQKGFEEHPEGWNLDSAVAHHGDKIIPHYDTSIISYQYDTKGNPINKIYKNSNRDIVETVTTLYSDSQKTLTYGINEKGDTVSVTNYKQNGNLITEINHDKKNLLYTNTNLYDGDKLIETVSIDKRMNFNRKETYKYDNKGNEIENISYK
jgi:hypothetical protein